MRRPKLGSPALGSPAHPASLRHSVRVHPDLPASSWPDAQEAERWVRALARTAERQRADRDVDEPYTVTSAYGVLWVNYGPLRFSVAGADVEVTSEQQLSDQIDRWVAFERHGGQQNLLDRDRASIDEWRAALPTIQALYEQAARLVFRDLEVTTSLRWHWRVSVHEDEQPPPPFPSRATGTGIWISETEPGCQPSRRPARLPLLWLDTDHFGTALTTGVRSVAEAVALVADAVQDTVIEEIHGAWPACPNHGHPLALGGADGTSWTCPTTQLPVADVGGLNPAS